MLIPRGSEYWMTAVVWFVFGFDCCALLGALLTFWMRG